MLIMAFSELQDLENTFAEIEGPASPNLSGVGTVPVGSAGTRSSLGAAVGRAAFSSFSTHEGKLTTPGKKGKFMR